MKKAEDYYKESLLFCEGNNGGIQRFKRLILETIKQAQLDAIEETCEVCAENATFIITEDAIIDAGIETDYYADGVFTTRISSESILNCAEILKKEIE